MLYHGSPVPDVAELRPVLSNHDRPYVYLTDSEELAAIYAYNPLPRPDGWFTYRWTSGGQLCYDEYFENALEAVYGGRGGYVYSCDAALDAMPEMPWVFRSERPLAVSGCRYIPDLYAELLRYESEGRLRVCRYNTLPEHFKRTILEIVEGEIQKCRLRERPQSEYALFVKKYFPQLL